MKGGQKEMRMNADRSGLRHKAPGDGDPVIAELEEALAFLVRGLEAVQRRRTYPLERAHYLLIRLIEREGAQTIGAAARHLLLDDSTVTRQVAAMVRDGLIAKIANPDDARSSLLQVTKAGLARAEEMRRERLRRLDRLFRSWSGSERAEGARVITHLNRSLSDVVNASEEPADD
jgi:DNA-binding MarR family transcriptional regulator